MKTKQLLARPLTERSSSMPTILTALLALALFTGTANAAFISAVETFDYSNGNLVPKGSASDPGWGGAWSSTFGDDLFTVQSGELVGPTSTNSTTDVTRYLSEMLGDGEVGPYKVSVNILFPTSGVTYFHLMKGGATVATLQNQSGNTWLNNGPWGSATLATSTSTGTWYTYELLVTFGDIGEQDTIQAVRSGGGATVQTPILDAGTDFTFDGVEFRSKKANGIKADNINVNQVPIPEPASLTLLGLGGLLVLTGTRRKQKLRY
jgi:hypothetical protein